MRRLPGVLLDLPLLLPSAVHPACAQPGPASPASVVRYQFGDDTDGSKGWANANFDDSSWPGTKQGGWPRPAFYSDGFVWVRHRVPVRAGMDQDGAMTLANASHLSPYLDGAELPVIAGVPLGIDSSIDYEESQSPLDRGSSLTFVSDGIVKARNAAGELFGFERTLQLSNSGANAIAQAAIDFGQEDDITVLSLTFTGPEVLHA